MSGVEHKDRGTGIRLDKITTRTGDRGRTSLPGRALPKHALEFEAIGDLDELGAVLGWSIVAISAKSTKQDLQRVQSHLFEIGGLVASGKGALGFDEEITWLEAWHARLNEQLPALTSFILAGGGECAARLQFARAVCRRSERSYWRLLDQSPPEVEFKSLFIQAGVYLNRLSDLLFTLARHSNAEQGAEEPQWVPR